MKEKIKKLFIKFLCTLLLICNISVSAIKPLEVRATGATVVASGAVVVEGVSLLLDLLAAGLLSIGAYELYENDERMQVVVDEYINTWTDTVTGVFNPGRTWGDVEDYTGTFVRDPNTGEWVRNPDTIPTDDRPLILSPEEQQSYGLSKGIYTNAKEAALELWLKNHGSGSGGNGDNSGGNNENKSPKAPYIIGTGVIASISAFLANITSGESGNETIDSWAEDTSVDTNGFTSLPALSSDGYYHYSYVDSTEYYNGYYSYSIYDMYTDKQRFCFYLSSQKIYPVTYISYKNHAYNSNGFDYNRNDSMGPNNSLSYNSYTNSDGVYSKYTTAPVFNSHSDALAWYNGDSSVVPLNKVARKLTMLDMHNMALNLPSTLGSFATLPSGKALKATALKDYTDKMVNYKTSIDEDTLSDPDKQTEKATQTADEISKESQTSTGTQPQPKPDPVPQPVLPTPEKITVDDIDASRDWRLVFPFCIPFDIIDLFNTLVAEPVAPRWEFPLSLPAYGIEYTFVIDFNDFNSLAEVLRTCETVMFILGLAVLTGKVIKW